MIASSYPTHSQSESLETMTTKRADTLKRSDLDLAHTIKSPHATSQSKLNMQFAKERMTALRAEIVSKTQTIRDLEQLAQELPRLTGTEKNYNQNYQNYYGYRSYYDSGERPTTTTPKVIGTLQNTIDSLRRQIREQEARGDEQQRGRDAVRKRSEVAGTELDAQRSENAELNERIQECEQRLKMMEERAENQRSRARELEEFEMQYSGSRQSLEETIEREKVCAARNEAAFRAAVSGAANVRDVMENKMIEINKHLEAIERDAEKDKGRVIRLRKVLEEQTQEQEKLMALKQSMIQEFSTTKKQIAAALAEMELELVSRSKLQRANVDETLELAMEALAISSESRSVV